MALSDWYNLVEVSQDTIHKVVRLRQAKARGGSGWSWPATPSDPPRARKRVVKKKPVPAPKKVVQRAPKPKTVYDHLMGKDAF